MKKLSVAKRSAFKNKIHVTVAAIMLLVPVFENVSFADAVSRADDNWSDAKSAEKDAKKAWDKCKADASRPNTAASSCESSLNDFMARKLKREKWTPEDEREYSAIQGECRQMHAASDSKKTDCVELQDQYEQAKQETKTAKRKLDRAQEHADNADNAEKKGPPGSEDCAECNKAKDKYKGKSGWESFADIIKAATPLGLGAMNLYGGVKAMNLESSDYQTYASSMSAAGLPFSQNTNGYGGIMGSMMGGNNMLSMLSMMNSGSGSMGGGMGGMGTMGGMSGSIGGFGMSSGMGGMMGGMSGYGGMGGFGNGMSGFGGMGLYGHGMSGSSPYGGYGGGFSPYGGYGGNSMGGYGSGYSPYNMGGNSNGMASMYPASQYGYPGNAYPYANAYAGLNNNGYGGLTNYNPWFSNYNSQLNAGGLPSFYQNQQSNYGSQLRYAQQQSLTTQDAQTAQQALYTAQSRYQQVLGNMSGSYSGTSYPYSTGYSGSYGSGYGSYYAGSSYSPYGYYGYGATVNNPPALNATRQ